MKGGIEMKKQNWLKLTLVTVLLASILPFGSLATAATNTVSNQGRVTAKRSSAKVKLNKRTKTLKTNAGYDFDLKRGKKSLRAKWRTSNKRVATVTQNGFVRGQRAGKATITARYKGKILKARVKVSNKAIFPKKIQNTVWTMTSDFHEGGQNDTTYFSNNTMRYYSYDDYYSNTFSNLRGHGNTYYAYLTGWNVHVKIKYYNKYKLHIIPKGASDYMGGFSYDGKWHPDEAMRFE